MNDHPWKIAALVCVGFISSMPAASCGPPSPYTPEEQAALRAQRQKQAQQYRNRLEEACAKAKEVAGDVPQTVSEDGKVQSGTLATAGSCFVGTTQSYEDPFKGKERRIFDEGVLVNASNGFDAMEVFEGKFLFLSNPPKSSSGPGTYVMVGRRTRGDGSTKVGIFVAEHILGRIDLVPADKPYLERIEKKHQEQVVAFREEQRRRAQSKRSSFSFGQALALGLGGAVIASSGIPADKMVEVGVAFSADVLTDGKAGMLDKLKDEYRSELDNATSSYDQANASAGGGSRILTCDLSSRREVCVEYEIPSTVYGKYIKKCKGEQARVTEGSRTCPPGPSCEHVAHKKEGQFKSRSYGYGKAAKRVEGTCTNNKGTFRPGP